MPHQIIGHIIDTDEDNLMTNISNLTIYNIETHYWNREWMFVAWHFKTEIEL